MKFKKAKKPEVTLDTAVVGGLDTKSKITPFRRVMLITIVILLVAAIALGLVLWRKSSDTSNQVSDDQPVQIDPAVAARASIDSLTDEELDVAAKQDADPNTNINAARVKAAALVQLNDAKAAVVVYEQIDSTGDGSYEDTVDYAFAVLATGDYKKSVELLQRAKTELQQSDAKDAVKKTYAEYIDNKIKAIQKEEAEL